MRPAPDYFDHKFNTTAHQYLELTNRKNYLQLAGFHPKYNPDSSPTEYFETKKKMLPRLPSLVYMLFDSYSKSYDPMLANCEELDFSIPGIQKEEQLYYLLRDWELMYARTYWHNNAPDPRLAISELALVLSKFNTYNLNKQPNLNGRYTNHPTRPLPGYIDINLDINPKDPSNWTLTTTTINPCTHEHSTSNTPMKRIHLSAVFLMILDLMKHIFSEQLTKDIQESTPLYLRDDPTTVGCPVANYLHWPMPK